MKTHNERGIALVLALFLMTALSLLGASMMFLSRSETLASMNYRVMSQSRYAAESGVQKAANFLLDPTFYPVPGGGGDPLTAYDMTKSPVLCLSGCTNINQPIVLSANDLTGVTDGCSPAKVASNYPISAVATNFKNAVKGTLIIGTLPSITLCYNAVATLVAMQHFDSFDGLPTTIQTWQIVGDGGLDGSTKTTVEVMATVETPKIPGFGYAAFATDSGCGALSWGGNGGTKSYDSGTVTGTNVPTKQNYDGDVGTNGNLNTKGTTDIYGNLYTPRTGVGSCTSGAVTALTTTGGATVWGDDGNPNTPIQLPKAITYPNTAVPTLSPLAAVSLNNVSGTPCTALGLTLGVNCAVNAGTKTITIDGHGSTLSLPQISLSSQVNLVFVAAGPGTAARYDVNSLTLAGQATVSVQAVDSTQHVMVNVVGEDNTATPVSPALDLQGGGFVAPTCSGTCSAFDATMLQFVYGGTGEIKFAGNSAASAAFYAPNATATLVGTTDFYGSIIGKTVSDQGGANIYYDRKLQKDFWIAGQSMLGTFTWKRF